MQCFKCLKEWLDTISTTTGVCPGCGTNLLKSLTNEPEKIETEFRLQYAIGFFGFEILYENNISKGIFKDLFVHNSRLQQLILKSIELKVPEKLKEIELNSKRAIMAQLIVEYLSNKAFIDEKAAQEITDNWHFAFNWINSRLNGGGIEGI